MIIITVDYGWIPGSNRNHQARTVRGAWIDHQSENTLNMNKISQ